MIYQKKISKHAKSDKFEKTIANLLDADAEMGPRPSLKGQWQAMAPVREGGGKPGDVRRTVLAPGMGRCSKAETRGRTATDTSDRGTVTSVG